MTNEESLLNRADDCVLLLIDLQERLVPAIDHGADRIAAAIRLLRAARLLRIPVRATEHMAERIGETVPEIAASLEPDEIIAKNSFSGWDTDALRAGLGDLPPRNRVIVAGTEAHVCVMQTALDLQSARFAVSVVMDATGSRFEEDRQAAFGRMRASGVTMVTSEMMIFEWLGRGDSPHFRDALAIIKERET